MFQKDSKDTKELISKDYFTFKEPTQAQNSNDSSSPLRNIKDLEAPVFL